MSVSPRKMGKRTCTRSQTYMLDYQFAMLNASPPHGEGRTLLDNQLLCCIVIHSLSLLFIKFLAIP